MLVFDVGAHRGQRTSIFVRLGARVIAIEPDPSNQRLLARRFPREPSRGGPVTVVGKAVSEKGGVAAMWVHAPGSGLNSLSAKWVETLGRDARRFGETVDFPGRQQVEATTLESLVNSFGAPQYIKIDVEGHEPDVLRGLEHPVPLLSFEVNLPEFLPEGIECVDILGRLAGDGSFNLWSDSGSRLALPGWLGAAEFASALRGCAASTVEVFWKAPAPGMPITQARRQREGTRQA